MDDIAIIGSGMSACGADYRLRQEGLAAVLYEQGDALGGHTRTHVYEGGWAFDEGPHVSFTKDKRIQEILAENVKGTFRVLHANIDNYWQGHWVKHPAQVNLHGLPDDLVVACLRDFVEASQQEPGTIKNYEEWLLATYGRTFAEEFPIRYARKVHTTEAANLTTDWLGPRLYRPSLDEILRGAISKTTPEVHYVTDYRYPEEGGFFAYLKPFLDAADVRLDHKVVEIEPFAHTLRFESGAQYSYDHLISSVPLPDLIPMIVGAPQTVIEAAERLAATCMVLVNIGIDRPDVGDTWSYFYDEDIAASRVSYPHRFSPSMAPPGGGSLQAEIYFSNKYLPLNEPIESFIEPTIDDLRRSGVLLESDRILHKNAIYVPYANIIHDHDKLPALRVVHDYLDEAGIRYCGRYGEWGYHWTDEAFLSGENAAQKVIDALH